MKYECGRGGVKGLLKHKSVLPNLLFKHVIKIKIVHRVQQNSLIYSSDIMFFFKASDEMESYTYTPGI